MLTWSIGGEEQERLELTINSVAPTEDGIRWLACQAIVCAGGFRGNVSLNLTEDELERFKTALEPIYERVGGEAELRTIEEQLFLAVKMDRLGHVVVTGRLLDSRGVGNQLQFALSFDQTTLWHTISEIDEVLFELRQQPSR